jgi:methyltransferase (TIGR00027 family)
MREDKPSVTARFVARTRATLDRPEVPTGDAPAELRLYESLGRTPLGRGRSGWHERMARRTAFFDRAALSALDRDVRQVVIVGAGYDGRPLRFASPGVTWFEVDHPATQRDKRARLAGVGASTDRIVFVPIDLTTGDLVHALEDAGFDRAAASLFIVEGLLGYLPRATTELVLAGLRELATPESRLAVAFPVAEGDQPAVRRLRRRARRWLVSALGEPWLTRFSTDDIDQLFATTAWRVAVELDTPQRLEGRRGVLIVGEPALAR